MDSGQARRKPQFEAEEEEDVLAKYLLGQMEEIEALGSAPQRRGRSREASQAGDLSQLADRVAYVNGVGFSEQSLSAIAMKRIPRLDGLEPKHPLVPDLLALLDTISDLLKGRTADLKGRSKLQERLAKAESDVLLLRKKAERLEDALKEKEKKIGELENTLHTTNSHAKKAITKIKAEGFEKEKLKANKNLASTLYEHELKKKDIEISKLKDALKKSSLLHKDRIDTATKYSRFELNNFYDGIEKDFNILDSKKTEIYKNMIDECNEFRSFLVELYTSLINTVKSSRKGSQADILHTLNPASLNKPFIHCREDVKISFVALYNDVRSLLL